MIGLSLSLTIKDKENLGEIRSTTGQVLFEEEMTETTSI